MSAPIREEILSAYAALLNAARNPYALEYEDHLLVSLYDAEETVSSDGYGSDLNSLNVQITAIDALHNPRFLSEEANNLLGKLHQSALSDRTLGGLCEDIRLVRKAPAYSQDPSDFVGAVLDVIITYRTLTANPYRLEP